MTYAPVQQHTLLILAVPAYQPQVTTASYSAPQPAVSAATNPLPYSPALPVYQPSLTMSSQPTFLSPSQQQNHQLQHSQSPSALSTQPAYQITSAPPGFSVQQPASTQQVLYVPQTQCTTLQAPYAVQPLRQPVPVPELPKLVHDSEREFADLKMALDHLLNPHTELSEHYKYCMLMEHLVLDEAKLIA